MPNTRLPHEVTILPKGTVEGSDNEVIIIEEEVVEAATEEVVEAVTEEVVEEEHEEVVEEATEEILGRTSGCSRETMRGRDQAGL